MRLFYRRPDIDVADASGEVPDSVKGEIELRNIKFAYPARPEQKIFEDFSLTIHPGETVALVGESGG